MQELRRAIAVDFDGCLCKDMWPNVGLPNWDVINAAIREQQNGAGIILWTCRSGKDLETAIEACKSWGLVPDAVNESLPEWIEAWGNDCRKVGADEYWDDKAVRMKYGDGAIASLAKLFARSIAHREEKEEDEVRIVLVKHEGDSRPYIFAVPDCDSADIVKGDYLLVKNKRGKQMACAACDSFDVPNNVAEAIAEALGGKVPLAPVIGKYELTTFKEEDDED